MSLQKIIDSAVNVEVNRSKLIAQSLSRSGRLLTVARNWANPFRFIVEPKPIWKWDEFRDDIETVMVNDRVNTDVIRFNTTGQNWMFKYQGNMSQDIFGGILGVGIGNDPTIASFSGTTMVINTPSANLGKQLFKVGDLILPAGSSYRYPYIVSAISNNGVINGSTLTVTTHRPYLEQTGVSLAGMTLFAGPNVPFQVKVSSLPNVRFIPGKFVEFTGSFELIEEVLSV